MKKFTIMLAALAAMAFTACEETKDDSPVLPTHEGMPVLNFLNEPSMADQYIELTEGNKGGNFVLTASQPTEYGYAATVRYQVQMSLTENFAKMNVVGLFPDCSNIAPTCGDVAEAICEQLGVKKVEELPAGYYKIYMRVKADIYTDLGEIVPNTSYMSNTVSFNKVRCGYLAIVVPDMPSPYYLRGGFSGDSWDAIPQYNFLTTAVKNEFRIQDIVTLAAGTNFKVADANWGNPNCGNNGEPCHVGVRYDMVNDSGSSDITLAEEFTGYVYLYKDGDKYTVLFQPAEAEE